MEVKDDVSVTSTSSVSMDVVSDTVNTSINTSTSMEVVPNEYVLTSSGLYSSSNSIIGDIPVWLINAFTDFISTGDGNIQSLIDSLQIRLDALDAGVQQDITTLQSSYESLSALITAITSKVDTNSAQITSIDATKVTADEATAISIDTVKSTFGGSLDVDSYMTNIVSTYANNNLASASEISVLSASIDSVGATLTSTDSVVSTISGWAATSSKFITDPTTGAITGWQFSDGSNIESSFKISADKFIIADSINIHQPFVIDATTGRSKFTGIVEFTGLGINTDSTEIDGGVITTGRVQGYGGSTYFDLGSATTPPQIKMDNGAGFVLDSTATGNFVAVGDSGNTPNVKGGLIEGAIISGGSIYGTTVQAVDIVDSSYSPNLGAVVKTQIKVAYGFSATTILTVPTTTELGTMLMVKINYTQAGSYVLKELPGFYNASFWNVSISGLSYILNMYPDSISAYIPSIDFIYISAYFSSNTTQGY